MTGRPPLVESGGAIDAIRQRAEATIPGPWAWFGNTEVDQVFLGTCHSGRLILLSPQPVECEGILHTTGLMFHDDGRMVNYRRIARYEVLNGRTREEAGLDEGACRTNSPLYREDIVGIDNPEAEFLAHAREDVDTLLAEVDRLQAELAKGDR